MLDKEEIKLLDESDIKEFLLDFSERMCDETAEFVDITIMASSQEEYSGVPLRIADYMDYEANAYIYDCELIRKIGMVIKEHLERQR